MTVNLRRLSVYQGEGGCIKAGGVSHEESYYGL